MRPVVHLALAALLGVVVLGLLSFSAGGRPSTGSLLDPWDGLYRAARVTPYEASQTVEIEGLDDVVRIYRDGRGVPHIYAATNRDAVAALGYVTAQDRLFQMDFIPRVAAGRLSAVLGEGALRTDRFMRSIGMDWGARRNADRIREGAGVEATLVDWYCRGVNAFIDSVPNRDLPLEFRLLGYSPERCSLLQVTRVLQFMSYDLTFRSDDARYGRLRAELEPGDYAELYPRHAPVSEPIIPPPFQSESLSQVGEGTRVSDLARPAIEALVADHAAMRAFTGFGFEHGKGSNNWAVAGSRSATGTPVLAGDMHLRVSLPAIWYEVHVVTPGMNVYGVTIPGAPLPIQAFNDHMAWAFTNTGSDQIDHVALQLTDDGRGYVVDGRPEAFAAVEDTVLVRGQAAVVDTLLFSRWGPVRKDEDEALAIRWVAHDSSRTLLALWGMLQSSSLPEFETALRFWDSPMQNVLYADRSGNIAIRSTGVLPIRRDGDGAGVIDGSRGGPIWVGRVPFDDLPYSRNPAQGYLASANQEPAGAWYPHYLGHDWRRSYRGIRINQLLRAKERHSVDDLMQYQSDLVAAQAVDFVALLDTVRCADEPAERSRRSLAEWEGETGLDDQVVLLFDEWLKALRDMTWDEAPLQTLRPYTAQLYLLLTGSLDPSWADRPATARRETVTDLICESLAGANAAMAGYATHTWGDHHTIVFSHLLGSDRLRALSRGPYPFPGYSETLSPGNGRAVTHTASWRVVVDLSTSPPSGFGVYAGGASGNPLHDLYDAHVDTFLNFAYFPLENPRDSMSFAGSASTVKLILLPTRS